MTICNANQLLLNRHIKQKSVFNFNIAGEILNRIRIKNK